MGEIKQPIKGTTDLTAIYNAIVAKGVTPSSKSVSDLASAISRIPGDTKHTLTVKSNVLNAWADIRVYEGSRQVFKGLNTNYGGWYTQGSFTI